MSTKMGVYLDKAQKLKDEVDVLKFKAQECIYERKKIKDEINKLCYNTTDYKSGGRKAMSISKTIRIGQ